MCFILSLPTQDPSAYPQPTSQDLAAFWDLLQLNIEDVRIKFQDLQRLKDSGWRLPPEKKVRGLGVQTILVSLQHSPRAKTAVCRRVTQMVVASVPAQALKVQNSKRNWAEPQSRLWNFFTFTILYRYKEHVLHFFFLKKCLSTYWSTK